MDIPHKLIESAAAFLKERADIKAQTKEAAAAVRATQRTARDESDRTRTQSPSYIPESDV